MTGKKIIKRKPARIQEGSIHVYFRGNHRNNIFYSSEDKIMFLKMCNKYAKEYQTIIQAFVIMDNHVHLQIKTEQLTAFMRPLLNSFSRWYNKEYLTSGQVFSSPFKSSCKHTKGWMVDSILYILQNPISANICKNPKDYLWSSYQFHFGQKNPFQKIIEVDPALIDNTFETKYLLDTAILEKRTSIAEIKEEKNYSWARTTYGELTKFLKTQIPAGESIYSLSADEIRELVIKLRMTFNASYTQIALLLHISRKEVVDACHTLV